MNEILGQNFQQDCKKSKFCPLRMHWYEFIENVGKYIKIPLEWQFALFARGEIYKFDQWHNPNTTRCGSTEGQVISDRHRHRHISCRGLSTCCGWEIFPEKNNSWERMKVEWQIFPSPCCQPSHDGNGQWTWTIAWIWFDSWTDLCMCSIIIS